MASAKEIKARLRAHVEQRIRDLSIPSSDNFYYNVAYGAIWAAYNADAISKAECDAYLAKTKPENKIRAAA